MPLTAREDPAELLQYDIAYAAIERTAFYLCCPCAQVHMGTKVLRRIAYCFDYEYRALSEKHKQTHIACLICCAEYRADGSYYVPQESPENVTGYAWRGDQRTMLPDDLVILGIRKSVHGTHRP